MTPDVEGRLARALDRLAAENSRKRVEREDAQRKERNGHDESVVYDFVRKLEKRFRRDS